MFPLKSRQLIRGCQEHIKVGLGCGADYVANYVDLYAPFDGTIETYHGTQGGSWLRLIRNNEKLEFAHLSKYIIKNGQVSKGDLIAVTGNTGQVTTGPHLHVQIFNKNGKRIDPETYSWDNIFMPTDAERVAQIKRLQEEVRKLTAEVLDWKTKYEKCGSTLLQEEQGSLECTDKLLSCDGERETLRERARASQNIILEVKEKLEDSIKSLALL